VKLSEKLALARAVPPLVPEPPVESLVKGTRLSDRIVAQLGRMPEGKGSRLFAQAFAKQGVPRSSESDRIFSLPRRAWASRQMSELARKLTDRFKTPDGTMQLRAFQAVALHEAAEQNGFLGPLAVGSGKTLCCLLLPEMMNSKCAVILVAPQLRNQLLKHDIEFYSKHFRVPTSIIHVVAYSTLSIEKGSYELESIKPDLIISDEAHNLRYRSATRTKRFLRYFKEHPETRFCGLSGTMTNRSIRDYAHLSELALKKNSPVPNTYQTLNDWAEALDATEFATMQPGVLQRLCEDGESVRSGFRRRFVDTPGIVATKEDSLGTSLFIESRKVEIPAQMYSEIERTRKTWVRPDGEEFQDVLELSRVVRQLACGFYYRWVWPDGKIDYEWLEARAAWHKEVRDFLQRRAKPGIDSPMLVARAAAHMIQCENPKSCEQQHFLSGSWAAWSLVKDRPAPPTEAVWLDEYLCHDVIALVQEQGPAIIWYEWDAVGRKIAELSGYPLLAGGEEADAQIALLSSQAPVNVVASLKAHGHGKNLQAWSKMVFTSCPSNGDVWEQALGRCHRPGQEADDVTAFVYLQTEEAGHGFEKALSDARYKEETQGTTQKLNYANKVIDI